jgi:hypothetical protein
MRIRGEPRPTLQEAAAEIIRRTASADGCPPYVIRLSDPPTNQERLQLLAARLQRRPFAIMPHKYTMEEWIARYGRAEDR